MISGLVFPLPSLFSYLIHAFILPSGCVEFPRKKNSWVTPGEKLQGGDGEERDEEVRKTERSKANKTSAGGVRLPFSFSFLLSSSFELPRLRLFLIFQGLSPPLPPPSFLGSAFRNNMRAVAPRKGGKVCWGRWVGGWMGDHVRMLQPSGAERRQAGSAGAGCVCPVGKCWEGGRGSPGKGQPPGTTTQQSKKGEEPPALAPTIFLLFSEKGYNTLEGLRVP